MAAPEGERLAIRLGGREIACFAGDTVAAALVDAGELACRMTRGGPRGVFCGMGVCHDCTMLVDGAPARTCMTPVRDGMTVDVEADARLPEAVAPSLERVALEADVLVVGAGPGGLAAAAVAAEAGKRVLLVDERAKAGGQYFKQPSAAYRPQLDRQYRQGRELIGRAERAGVSFLHGAQVWAAAGPQELLAVDEGHAYTLRTPRLVLATGAYERGVPLPGWTLPGFMTTGAAQTLMRAYGVVPGRRVLVSGNGPLNVQVAAELVRAGATVVALCETARPWRPGALARMAAAAPDLLRDGLGYGAALRGVPKLFGHAVVRAEGDGRVERAAVARLDGSGERWFDVDAVCAGFGFLPSNELARTLGVEHVWDDALGQLAVVRDARGRTNVEDVWVVGDGGGTGGARLARAVGLLAGADAAGVAPPAGAERDRRRNERFQRALWRLYAAPRPRLAEADTLVCRCEAVTLRAVEEALAGGIGSIGALKRVTRAGMGRCQGRYCAPVLAELTGGPLDESAWFAPGTPVKPLPVGVLAEAMRVERREV